MEAKVTDLHNSVYDLRQKVDLFIHELPKKKDISQEEIPYEAPAPAHLGAAADAGVSGPMATATTTITGVSVPGLLQPWCRLRSQVRNDSPVQHWFPSWASTLLATP